MIPNAAVGWLRERPLAEQSSILPALENHYHDA
jgi:hypothetical protein